MRIQYLYFSGYPQGYPPTPAAPPPPPALTATAPPRIIRQPLPPTTVVATPVANGTFHAAAPPAMDSLPLATTTGTRPASFHLGAKTVPYRTQNSLPKANHRYQRNGNSLGKGLKRKADELCGSPSPNSSTESSTADGEGKADSTISYDLLQPLYCKVCRVTLNAPAQAKQHYEGKNHSKKMRLYEDSDIDKDKNGSLESNGSLGDQVSSKGSFLLATPLGILCFSIRRHLLKHLTTPYVKGKRTKQCVIELRNFPN